MDNLQAFYILGGILGTFFLSIALWKKSPGAQWDWYFAIDWILGALPVIAIGQANIPYGTEPAGALVLGLIAGIGGKFLGSGIRSLGEPAKVKEKKLMNKIGDEVLKKGLDAVIRNIKKEFN